MAVPKYDEFYRDFLDALSDGRTITSREVRSIISSQRQMSEDDLTDLLPSGRQTVFANRVSWSGFYLMKAGLVERPARGKYAITPEGLRVQKDASIVLNNDYLMTCPSFVAFRRSENSTDSPHTARQSTSLSDDRSDTPQDVIDAAFRQMESALADELMEEIIAHDPAFFERLVVQLLLGMGYGGPFDDAGIVTQRTGDGGIDGIIKEDKLGFRKIYIQAKRWDPSHTVGRPDIQRFSGALHDQGAACGLSITTARFSQGAKDTAQRQHIILVDGQRLTRLMIEYNIGVSVTQTYYVKRVDTDFFSEDEL